MSSKIFAACAMLLFTAVLGGCAAGKISASVGSGSPAAKHVYLAGPFFNEEEINNVELAEKILTDKGYSIFSPMRHKVDAEEGTTEWAKKIFETDKAGIEKADLLVILYYGSNSDTGTAWECGYASAIGKPTVLVHVYRDSDSNLMMHCGSTTNVYLDELADFDLEAMPVREYEGKMF